MKTKGILKITIGLPHERSHTKKKKKKEAIHSLWFHFFKVQSQENYVARSQNKKKSEWWLSFRGWKLCLKGNVKGLWGCWQYCFLKTKVCSISESSFSCTAMRTYLYVYYTSIKNWSWKNFNRLVSSIKRLVSSYCFKLFSSEWKCHITNYQVAFHIK